MTQESLFEASVYVQHAYDQLVLAYDVHESRELATCKWQLLQAWLTLQQARMRMEWPAEALELTETEDNAPLWGVS